MPAVPLALAREIGYPAGETLALANLSLGAYYAGDMQDAVAWARQAQRIDPAGIPGWIARRCQFDLIVALIETGDMASAWQCCADGLARARQAGDLTIQAYCLIFWRIWTRKQAASPRQGRTCGNHSRSSPGQVTRWT